MDLAGPTLRLTSKLTKFAIRLHRETFSMNYSHWASSRHAGIGIIISHKCILLLSLIVTINKSVAMCLISFLPKVDLTATLVSITVRNDRGING